ncbi:zonadhesin-like isoform X19 [Epinephelus moara]|uniref:zonadhesin-like isoform X19 n=1 Tax=Epinephelus moara TaxID=300413 RepID=UPI00214F2DC2|nr:zonadhesin-like isoform X19 [Epinephelus moara]
MLGGIRTDLLVTVTLLLLTQTGTQCRAEVDFSLVTLPDWSPNADYVSQCFYDRQNNFICDWTQWKSEDFVATILESGPLGLEGEACLEFWYISPVVTDGSELRVLLRSSAGLKEIWTLTALPRDSWRQVFVPLNVIEPGTQVVVEAVSTSGQFAFNLMGVRRGQCGPQCESNTELWTDESTRCLCSSGQLSCSPSQCPEGQICGPQTGSSRGISTSGTCTIHSHTDCSTFDGVLFRFMAPCTYTLAKTCSPSEALPMFSVEVVNEQNWNSSLPTVQQVVVNVGKFRVSLLRRQTHRVVVNGVWRKLPLSLSSGTINIKSNPAAVELETSFGLSVSFDNAGAVHVKLPSTYSDKVCGLCGNFNHLRRDDFRKPDGTNAQDATALAKSWQTEENTSSCETILVPHQCDPQEEAEYASELYCGGLLSSTGPFAGCLAVLGAESYFRGCVVDMCTAHGDPAALCETLQVYADICQEAGVAVPVWRNSTFCPLQCGENSHYNSCADGCPDVCSVLDIVGSCGGCDERCECDSGFKLSGGKCVPAEDCGCWYSGKHYEKGATFSEGECVQQCQCMGNNEVQCTRMQCANHEVCKVKDGVKGCFPFKPATCSVYGDPHYITFDGMAYDFQGGCSYTLTTTCGGQSSVQFTVIGHNMHPPIQNFTRSKLEAVTLKVEDLYLTLNQSGEVYVKNRPVLLPYFTNGTYGSVWVDLKKNYIVMETTFGLRITIDTQNRLFLQVDERYKYELCGLCGTYSDRQDDDFVAPEGQNATGPFEFGDSWRVPGDDECVSHPNDPRLCDYDQENEAYNECYTILGDAFKPCHESIHPSIYLNSCVYDYCATNGDRHTLCESLKSYAAACSVAGVELPHWQMDTACADPPTTATLPTSPAPTSPTPDQPFCPINCDFERNLCGWEQLVQDSFDWTRHSGPTPTSLTGPNQDHTTGAGYYMYIEGNSVTHGDSARLWSSNCHYNGPLCLNFWYHMYGSATAMALNIYLLKDKKATKLWSMRNNQGPEWHLGNADIRVSGPFQIIVEGIRGSTDQSDVAIDDISIHFGACSGTFPGLGGGTELPPITTEVLPSHSVCNMDCSFDSNLCSWDQMITDAFDWTWQSGSTPTLMTGPSADHTGDGHYLYIEASSVTYGDMSRLISPECSDSGPQCLQFWYHMYGSADTMGLHVYLLQNRSAHAVWRKRNDQGNMWHLAQVDITTTGAFQIIFEGRRGSNEESDVAIDDVKLYRGRCSNLSGVATNPPSVPVPTTAAPQPPLVNVTAQLPDTAPVNGPLPRSVCNMDCSFDSNLCSWDQMITDAFDWTWQSGSTPTLMTGPSADHTGDGHYLYIEASSVTYGDMSRLISPECSDSGPQCLQFWYHMYGSADTMGLHVYLLQNRSAHAVWRKRNDQGNMWHLAQVDITTTGAFQIIFEGRIGSNDQSDVAIDDVSLHRGHCTDVAKPTKPAPSTFNPVVTEGPERPPANSPTAAQPQTATSSKPQRPSTTTATTTTTPTTTAATTNCDTQTPSRPATTTTPKTSNPNVPTTKPQLPITSTTTTTSGPHPPATEHPGAETSEQPEPEITARPQTTAAPEQPAISTNEPQTTAGPHPTTQYPGLETSEQPEPEITHGPQTTTEPEQPDTLSTDEPQTPAGPHPTTEHPGLETSEQPEPEITDGPQTTAEPEQPDTSSTDEPKTPAGPHPTTAHPGLETSEQPEPEITENPQMTTRPGQPATPNEPQTSGGPQPQTTESQEPTAGSQPPTTARPQPPTTARPQPPTTARPQPPTETQPQTTIKPQPPTTARPQPPTTARPQPPTTARPQPPTARPQPPTTPIPTPSCPANSHYTTCIPTCSPTCTYLNGPPRCSDDDGCVPGCVCDDGFVRRGRVCVPIQQCGCVDRNGTKHHFNEVWYTDHCRQKCECEKDDGVGEIDCDDDDECDGNAVCLQNEEGDYYCQSTGFGECIITRDPEYRTFDKMKHDFEGEHSYVLVRTNNLPNNLLHVYIEGINTAHDDDDSHHHDDSSSEEDHSRRVRDEDEDDDDDDDDDKQDDDSDENEEHHRLQELKIRVYDHTVEFKKHRRLMVSIRGIFNTTLPPSHFPLAPFQQTHYFVHGIISSYFLPTHRHL